MKNTHMKFKNLAVINLGVLLITVFMVPTYASVSFTVSQNYEFILFYSANCPYCIKFAPVLKQYANSSGIPIRAFIVGREKSNYFPASTVVNREIIAQFFGKNGELVLPTLFLLNTRSFRAYPVTQGALTYAELQNRMQKLIPKIIHFETRGTYAA